MGTSRASVRAERTGDRKHPGNGRVYHIRFTASDGTASCSGDVTVGVPHDQGHGPAIDDGPIYDSTVPFPPVIDDGHHGRDDRGRGDDDRGPWDCRGNGDHGGSGNGKDGDRGRDGWMTDADWQHDRDATAGRGADWTKGWDWNRSRDAGPKASETRRKDGGQKAKDQKATDKKPGDKKPGDKKGGR